jgi:hypothetical protein
MEVSGQLYPRENRHGTESKGDCVGPKADQDAVEKRKMLLLPGIESGPSSPSLSRLSNVLHNKKSIIIHTYDFPDLLCGLEVKSS